MSTPNELKSALDTAINESVAQYQSSCPHAFRRRKVSQEDIVKLLHTMDGASIQKELFDAGVDISASAFVQRRKNISSTVFGKTFERFNELCDDTATYHGYHIFAIDGTTVNLARDETSRCFMQNPSNLTGYNQMHVTPLYDVLAKTYLDCVIEPQPRMDEVGALTFFLAWWDFPKNTLIVADRGFEAYSVFAAFFENRSPVDFLIRVRQGRQALRCVSELPLEELDIDSHFVLTTRQTNEDKAQGRIYVPSRKNTSKRYSDKTRIGHWSSEWNKDDATYPMTLRVVRFMLDTGEYETLVTSLPRSFTLAQIKALYASRWGIEVAFRELKYSNGGLVNLHGRSEEFSRQQIYAAMSMSNLTNRIVRNVIVTQRPGNKLYYQVNMKMAHHICKSFFRTPDADETKLIRDILRYTEPWRPGRCDERKIRAKSFVPFTYRVA